MSHPASGHSGQTEIPPPTAPVWSVPTVDMWSPMSSGFDGLNKSLGAAASEVNREWFEFLQGRLRQDFELPKRLLSCKGPAEFFETYAEFSQNALNDYLKEFAELTRLTNSAANASINAIRHETGPARTNKPRSHARN